MNRPTPTVFAQPVSPLAPLSGPADNPVALARLHDRARLEAEQLRREAIDDFWRGSWALLGTSATRTLRAADRLRRRLERRAALAG